VSVDLQLGAVFGVDERTQVFSADLILVTAWLDSRLRNPAAPAVAEYDPAAVLDGGQIWSPLLTFANMRDSAPRLEGVVRVHNTGRVVVVERFVGRFTAPLDARDFPFDTQTLEWRLRSTRYARGAVKFVPASAEEQHNASALLQQVRLPPSLHFRFSCTIGCRTLFLLTKLQISSSRRLCVL
jgi:hypothetical protein